MSKKEIGFVFADIARLSVRIRSATPTSDLVPFLAAIDGNVRKLSEQLGSNASPSDVRAVHALQCIVDHTAMVIQREDNVKLADFLEVMSAGWEANYDRGAR